MLVAMGLVKKMFAIWTFISIDRRVTQVSKFAFGLRGESILIFKGSKKNIRKYHDFQSSQVNIHPSSFSSSRSFSAQVLLATQWPQTPPTLIHPATPLIIYIIIYIYIYIILCISTTACATC